ncbi:MAG TPA: ABC transporter ATP-binding protein [Novosphingobium sp.]|nr:ABC transporter ATP-binding protein [Novosphingobium sp.]
MTLSARDLHLKRGGRALIGGIDLTLAPGELVCLLGPNGAGKSTLIRCLDGIWKPTSGHVAVDDRPLPSLHRAELARTIAYVPQHSGETMGLDVTQIVTLGRAAHRHRESAGARRALVAAALQRFALAPFAHRTFDSLSGGEKQRVLIARAAVQEARYLLLDEPTSALDLRHQLEALSQVRAMVDRTGVGALMAIHDLSAAARFADRIALMKEGRLVAMGDWRAILTPERLRDVFGVSAHVGEIKGVPYVLPTEVP